MFVPSFQSLWMICSDNSLVHHRPDILRHIRRYTAVRHGRDEKDWPTDIHFGARG